MWLNMIIAKSRHTKKMCVLHFTLACASDMEIESSSWFLNMRFCICKIMDQGLPYIISNTLGKTLTSAAC